MDEYPVHSFQTLLKDLATLTKNRIQPNLPEAGPFDQLTRPTPVQQRAFDLPSPRARSDALAISRSRGG